MLQHHLDGPLPQLLRMFPVWSWPLPLTSQSLQESLGRFSGTSLGPLTAANRCLRLPPVVQGRLHHRKILSASRGVRVVGEAVEALGGAGVVGAKACLEHSQGALMQDPRIIEVALGAQDKGKVVEALGGIGVVGA